MFKEQLIYRDMIWYHEETGFFSQIKELTLVDFSCGAKSNFFSFFFLNVPHERFNSSKTKIVKISAILASYADTKPNWF